MAASEIRPVKAVKCVVDQCNQGALVIECNAGCVENKRMSDESSHPPLSERAQAVLKMLIAE